MPAPATPPTDRFMMTPPIATWARAALPLQGLTVLAVEDSRFACDALRLICHRSGARLRRADSLAAARGHLRVYRPDVVIVDLGLPDGRGEELIGELARQVPRLPVVLGTSGYADGRAGALAAGADGFLEKPLQDLRGFQQAVLHHLPDRGGAIATGSDPLHPDPLALHDDLAHAAGLIAAGPTAQQRHYVAGFVGGLARHAQDAALEQAASCAADGPDTLAHLALMLRLRLGQGPGPFGAKA